MMTEHRDEEARSLAATTVGQNVVVTASAGTGKTTLLITRLVHLIVKSPDPVPLPQIVALTFMNKAANEIKIRLRECLEGIQAAEDSPASAELWDRYRLSAADLRTRYRLSSEELQERAEAALRDMENSQIGTIHSFAAHVLRLFPLEAGVDPGFRPDEEFVFDEHFAREWAKWLDEELGPRGTRYELWRRVLAGSLLEDLRDFAKALANDAVPLHEITAPPFKGGLQAPLRTWFEEKQRRIRSLLEANPAPPGREPRNIEKLLAAAEQVFGLVLKGGTEDLSELSEESRSLLKGKGPGGSAPTGWDQDAFTEARGHIKTAKGVLAVDSAYFSDALLLLAPFVEQCRQRFLEAGLVTFDGLLARARDLLRGHPDIRRRLKRLYRAILVDEFQDTDPVQYEILLFLSEEPEQSARGWKEIRLQPGKLFIVGDPKQSIFAFRRADIEAFQEVTRLIIQQRGLDLTLTRNFRSHPTILAAVNGVFGRLIRESPGLQPMYAPLEPDPDRRTAALKQGVELRLVGAGEGQADQDPLNAEQAVEIEAEALARWLKTEVVGTEILTERDGRKRPVEPGDIAILFRTFTQGWEYLGALRRHGLPYVAEGEKHFYQRQEVIDLVNLLRCIQNPHDQIALAGLLRSTAGALTDQELMDLAAPGLLEYYEADHPQLTAHPRAAHLHRLFGVLKSLQRDCPQATINGVMDLIFDRVPLLELAAAGLHGEQAVANLWKVRALAEDLAGDPGMTLAGFVALLQNRIADPPDESESGLAEETSSEAVRVMSMHKAKGLEFPIVVLVGLHAGPKNQPEAVQVRQDWSTGTLGLRLGDRCTLGGVFVSEKLAAREAAERRRLLYVGMTRAKERLVLSGAITRHPTAGNFLSLLKEGVGESVGRSEVAAIVVGQGTIAQTIIAADTENPVDRPQIKKRARPLPDLQSYERRWKARTERWSGCRQQVVFLTPSALPEQNVGAGLTPAHSQREGVKPSPTNWASAVGGLVHKALEDWRYQVKAEVVLENVVLNTASLLPDELSGNRQDILAEVKEILEAFFRSDAYGELQGATILGREVPFLMPLTLTLSPLTHCTWPVAIGRATGTPSNGYPGAREYGGSSFLQSPSPLEGEGGGEGGRFRGTNRCLMEGRIDLLYEKDGKLWVADYKTDRVSDEDLLSRAEGYRSQAQVYTEAVRRALGREPAGFKVIFVRVGKAIQVLV